jgi:ribonuclease HI
VENGLAVGVELSHRKIKDGVVCLACGRNESLLHRFWSCPHSASAWAYLKEYTGVECESPPRRLVSHAELKGWLLDWIGKGQQRELELAFTLIYNLLQARNDARESQEMQDPAVIVRKSIAAVEEWHSLRTRPTATATRPITRWQVPPEGWCKVNTDGAYRSAEGNAGGGVVVRDHHGGFLAGACHFFTNVADAEGAELHACRQGLLLARRLQVPKVVLETDSSVVVSKLVQEDMDRSFYGPLIEEIKELLRGFDEGMAQVVRRTANSAAHSLAKEGCENNVSRVWLGVPPALIVNVLNLDISVS